MDTVTVKTCELIGSALDYAVAKCEGNTFAGDFPHLLASGFRSPKYSTDWSQGGPIIERELSKVFRNVGGTWSAMILKDVPLTPEEQGASLALSRRAQWSGSGPTPLIAAMRCYVASKLGDTVQIPTELVP